MRDAAILRAVQFAIDPEPIRLRVPGIDFESEHNAWVEVARQHLQSVPGRTHWGLWRFGVA